MSIYSEPSPNIEHIRAVAEDVALRISRKYGISVFANAEENYCWIALPCAEKAIISINEIDAGMIPLSAYVIFAGGMDRFFTKDYADDAEFADAVASFVTGFLGRQIRVTRKSRFLGGLDTKAEYLENGEWKALYDSSDHSFITRILTWRSRSYVCEYDFRIN